MLSQAERGYLVAEDDTKTTAERHEVRELIDPPLAARAAKDGTPAQRKALEKSHKKQCAAHDANDVEAFIRANVEFRTILRSMSGNALLSRCSELLEDQAQPARRAIFDTPEYRALEIEHDGKVTSAILAKDEKAAEREMRAYVVTVRNNLNYVLEK
jgi:DNA-binding GntR family transcriptional regulator